MFRTMTLAAALVTACATAGLAQSGTQEERAACRHDVTKFCRHLMQAGEDQVSFCLQANRGSLSRRCSEVLARHGR
jgi:hypothetical protein